MDLFQPPSEKELVKRKEEKWSNHQHVWFEVQRTRTWEQMTNWVYTIFIERCEECGVVRKKREVFDPIRNEVLERTVVEESYIHHSWNDGQPWVNGLYLR